MTVHIATHNAAGKVNKNFRITSNDPLHKSMIVQCVANVLTPVKIEPIRYNFGELDRRGAAKSKAITIKRGDGGPLKLEIDRSSDADAISAELREITPGEHYELNVSIHEPWPTKKGVGYVRIATGVPEAAHAFVRFTYSISPYLRAMPERIVVPADLPQDQETIVNLIWHDGKQRPVITAVVTDSQLKAQVLKDENGVQQVKITVPAGYKYNKGRSSVIIRIDDEKMSMLQIPVTLQPAGGPSIHRQPIRRNHPQSSPTAGQPASKSGGAAPTARPRPVVQPSTKPTAKPDKP